MGLLASNPADLGSRAELRFLTTQLATGKWGIRTNINAKYEPSYLILGYARFSGLGLSGVICWMWCYV